MAAIMPQRIIVKFKDGTPSERIVHRRKKHGGTQLKRWDALGKIRVIELPDDTDVQAVLDDYNAQPEVESAQVNSVVKADYTPDDPQLSLQWAVPWLGMADVWDSYQGATSVVVAVLDSGVDYLHEDLIDRCLVLPGSNFDEMYQGEERDVDDPMDNGLSHGTRVASHIASTMDNGKGVAGVAPLSTIMPVKVLGGPYFYGTAEQATDGILFAVENGAKVINCSFTDWENIASVEAAVAYAQAQGCIVVAAMGNTGDDETHYPAAYDGVIGVASHDNTGAVSATSTYGASCDFAAPGVNVRHAVYTDNQYDPDVHKNYAYQSGTSFAAPHVSGIVALMVAANPAVTVSEIYDALKTVATNPNNPGGWDEHYGWGSLSGIVAAIDAVVGDIPDAVTEATATLTETGVQVEWTHDGADVDYFIVQRAVDWVGDNPTDADFEQIAQVASTEREYLDAAVLPHG